LRGEGDDKKKEPDGRTYIYEKCPGCGAKLHIGTRYCLKCGADYLRKCMAGEWQQVCYSSHNPEDAMYSRRMNKIEKCMACANVLQRGISCEKKNCFASGRGKCENCKTFDNTIFDCCQEVQKEEGVVTEENIKWLSEHIGQLINPAPGAKPPAVRQQEYDDEIPF